MRDHEFQPGTYDLVNKNCNHFSDAFCQVLVGTGIPGWVNRMASVGGRLGLGTKSFQIENPDDPSEAARAAAAAEANAKVEKERGQKKELSSKQKALLAKLKK